MSPAAYEVHLEMFEGPLDLLLYLIKKDDLDIRNIPIAKITQEYLEYLDLMKELNLEIAGEFLVTASTLIQIKAHSLLPSSVLEGEEGPDPAKEFAERLLEYQKFKEASKYLDTRAAEWDGVFYRGAPRFAERDKSLNIRIFDLLATVREILDRADDRGRLIKAEEFRIEEKIAKIQALLEGKPYILFRDIFEGERRKLGILTCFLAVLELIKTQKVIARQEAPFAEILIYKRQAPPEIVSPVWPSDEPAAKPPEDGGAESGTPSPSASQSDPAADFGAAGSARAEDGQRAASEDGGAESGTPPPPPPAPVE